MRSLIFLVVLVFFLAPECFASAKDIQTSGEFDHSYEFSLSPDGRFAVLQLGLNNFKQLQLQYIGLEQGISKPLVPASSNFQDIFYYVSSDSQRIVAVEYKGISSNEVEQIEVLTINSVGDVVTTDTVYQRSNQSIVKYNEVGLTKYNDLVYLQQTQNTQELVAYNIVTGVRKSIFQDPKLKWRSSRALTWSLGSAELNAIQSEYLVFATSSCRKGSCHLDSVYKLSTAYLGFSRLAVPDHDDGGRIDMILTDEKSSTPWILVNHCGNGPKGVYRTAFNIDTAQEIFIQNDPGNRCTWSGGDYFKVNGNTFAMENLLGSGNLLFDLASRKTLATDHLYYVGGLSSDGSKAFSGFTFYNFPAGKSSLTYQTPPAVKSPKLASANLDQEFFVVADLTAQTGQIPLWKLWHDSLKAPVQLDPIRANDQKNKLNNFVCHPNPARQTTVCTALEKGSQAHMTSHMVEF